MERWLLAVGLVAGAWGCVPDVARDEPAVAVVFDPGATPAVIPTPNDIVRNRQTGIIEIPDDPNASPAQREFTRDYLNTLDGFPATTAATVGVSGALDPASVDAQSVIVLPLNPIAQQAVQQQRVTPTVAYDDAARQITVRPGAGAAALWPKGGNWAVAVVGGEAGVRTASNEEVFASPAWVLVRGEQALITCPAGGSVANPAGCTSSTPLIATPEAAVRLETLRLGLQPLFGALAQRGVAREDVLALWTFTTASRPEPTFDPGRQLPGATSATIPFPNNLALSADGGRVDLPDPAPLPDGGVNATQAQLIAGLETLDGFSTTGTIVSENSDALGALLDGQLVLESLDAGTRFVRVEPGGTTPEVSTCVWPRQDCPVLTASRLPDGGTPEVPEQLQFTPTLPLDERANYAAVLTTTLRGTINLGGQTVERPLMAPAAWALMRMENPLVDGNGRSLVSGVPDANAAALEPARAALKPAIDGLVARGIPRRDMALATVFRTQSTVSSLTQVVGLAQTLPAAPVFVFDASAALGTLTLPNEASIGKLWQGRVTIANLLTGTGGTFNPNPAQARAQQVEFVMTTPAGTAPAEGWPVVIFGHGLTRSRNDLLNLAGQLAAQGLAAIATDVVLHGERTVCVGAGAVIPGSGGSDDAACADPAAQRCETDASSVSFGRCVARNAGTRQDCTAAFGTGGGDALCAAASLGRCVPASAGSTSRVCEGGSFRPADVDDSTPAVSGWNILNTQNLFATRDNFRQQAIDLTQLVRMLRSPELAAALGADRVDPARIHYAGQSLGGILGTLFTAVSPDVHRAVLNVPGADLPLILLTSPSFSAQRDAFVATLAGQGITQGTPAFDNFLNIARWILDPADSQNYAFSAANLAAPADPPRKLFIQYIEGDQTIPNPSTERLIAAANREPSRDALVVRFDAPAGLAEGDRHGFLLNFADPTLTGTAQVQAATFLETGALP